MCHPKSLLKNNQRWAQQKIESDPDYFTTLSEQRRPKYMWIGCSDSRVPANEIVGLKPGQVFVHRNVANQVHHTDLNCLAAVQYAVDVLDVEHIIVTGHYDCGGVHAAMGRQHFGMVDNWVRSIRDTYMHNKEAMEHGDRDSQVDQLCEFNVIRQVENLSHTRIVQNAWERGKKMAIHGWIYRLKDGLLHDLDVTRYSSQDVEDIYHVH